MKRLVFFLALPPLLCGQALPSPTSPDPALEFPATTLSPDSLRVASVGYRIARRARAYCPQPLALTGMGLFHLDQYRGALKQSYAGTYGLDRGPAVLWTVAGSPAARAGLRAGDVLLAVDGQPLASPKPAARGPAAKAATAARNTELLIESALAKGSASLRILRDGREGERVVTPVSGCPLRIRLVTSNTLGASSRDGAVLISTRMLAFVRNDDELALVIGHELAHVVLHHAELLEDQSRKGFKSRASRIRATEVEADRLGLRLAWVAGYDPSVALAFWPRLDAAHGGWLRIPTGHPGAGERVRLTQAALAELARETRPNAKEE